MHLAVPAGISHFIVLAACYLILAYLDVRLCVYPLVYSLGAIVGVTEILMRFRDEPIWAINSSPGSLYALLNGTSSLLAFCLIRYLDIWFGAAPRSEIGNVLQVLTAGLGAMSFLRSGIFVSKTNADDKETSFGPAIILQRVLDVLSSQVDRQRAIQRDKFVASAAQRIRTDEDLSHFAFYASSLMQTLSDEQTQNLHLAMTEVQSNPQVPLFRKNQVCLLLLLNLLGEDALKAALDRMTDSEQPRTPLPPPTPDLADQPPQK
jgi:hypothetical protein